MGFKMLASRVYKSLGWLKFFQSRRKNLLDEAESAGAVECTDCICAEG